MRCSAGLIHTRHFDEQYCDKETKRHFSSNIFFPVCIENIFWGDNSKYFEMSLQYFEEKKIFLFQYLVIVISHYRKRKCLVQWFPNFFGSRTTLKNSVVQEGQNIDLDRDSRTTSANLADQQWSAEQTLGITGLVCNGPKLNGETLLRNVMDYIKIFA
jgi:hypothetical protein